MIVGVWFNESQFTVVNDGEGMGLLWWMIVVNDGEDMVVKIEEVGIGCVHRWLDERVEREG
ncbi:hypothetical protein Hanom_Chr11g01034361 [Helianthus anomalus]